MPFGKIKRTSQGLKKLPRRGDTNPAVAKFGPPKVGWITGQPAIEDNEIFGGRDWSDLSNLVDRNTPLGRAVRHGQRYFTDAELNDAIQGRSDTVILTTIDNEPVFLNAAMMSRVMVGETIAD